MAQGLGPAGHRRDQLVREPEEAWSYVPTKTTPVIREPGTVAEPALRLPLIRGFTARTPVRPSEGRPSPE